VFSTIGPGNYEGFREIILLFCQINTRTKPCYTLTLSFVALRKRNTKILLQTFDHGRCLSDLYGMNAICNYTSSKFFELEFFSQL